MKKNILLIMMLICSLVNAQSGVFLQDVNTTLELKSQPTNLNLFDGMLPPKITGNQLKAKNYQAIHDGAIVYVTQPADLANRLGQVINVNSSGHYFFSGPENVWYRFLNSTNNWLFEDAFSVEALNRVNLPLTSVQIVDNIDLNLEIQVVVPKKSKGQIIINSSLPIGYSPQFTGSKSTVGTKLIRTINNVSTVISDAERKQTLFFVSNVGAYLMTTINSSIIDEVINDDETDLIVTYEVKGYVDLTVKGSNPTFIFNMFANSGENYNWGRGSMNAQVYKKNL